MAALALALGLCPALPASVVFVVFGDAVASGLENSRVSVADNENEYLSP
jgi:hypothetical protein